MPTSSLTAASPLLHKCIGLRELHRWRCSFMAPYSSTHNRCMTRRQRTTHHGPQAAPAESALDASRLDDVAGHKIVRRLAVGTRATLLLAHASANGESHGPSSRVLKVFRADTSAASIDVELAALTAVAAPHVVRLLDVASINEGAAPCFVLERLPGPSLSSYLGRTSSLSAGQAVTVLAPLCSALQALHNAGVTHGALHLRRIVFDHRGSPTLTGFGRGALRQSPKALHSAAWPGAQGRNSDPTQSRETLWRDAVVADQRGLLEVVDEVLSRIDGERMPTGFDLARLSRAITEAPSREFLPQLERALFAIAPAQVVSLAAAGSEPESKTQMRLDVATYEPAAARAASTEYDWSPSTPDPAPAQSENRLVAALRVLGVSSTGLEFASSVIDIAARLSKRHRPRPETPMAEEDAGAGGGGRKPWQRKPLLVAASCAAIATTALLMVLPSPTDGAQAGGEKTSTTRTPASAAPSGDAAPPAQPEAESAAAHDDPVVALQVLSRVTDACAAAAEPEGCLTTVFQEDYLESQPVDDPLPVIEADDAVMTGSWGGSALVAARLNGQPASFLLLKGEAGWRVRDVFTSD